MHIYLCLNACIHLGIYNYLDSSRLIGRTGFATEIGSRTRLELGIGMAGHVVTVPRARRGPLSISRGPGGTCRAGAAAAAYRKDVEPSGCLAQDAVGF